MDFFGTFKSWYDAMISEIDFRWMKETEPEEPSTSKKAKNGNAKGVNNKEK